MLKIFVACSFLVMWSVVAPYIMLVRISAAGGLYLRRTMPRAAWQAWSSRASTRRRFSRDNTAVASAGHAGLLSYRVGNKRTR